MIAGVGGSGKSTLLRDVLHAEGQRRYVASLSASARRLLERRERPDADEIAGVPPAVLIDPDEPAGRGATLADRPASAKFCGRRSPPSPRRTTRPRATR